MTHRYPIDILMITSWPIDIFMIYRYPIESQGHIQETHGIYLSLILCFCFGLILVVRQFFQRFKMQSSRWGAGLRRADGRLISFQCVPKTLSLLQQAMLDSYWWMILWSVWLWPERKGLPLFSLLLSPLYSRPPTFGGRLGREHTIWMALK